MIKFEIGDKVILKKGFYFDAPNNPVWGGKYGYLAGVVDSVNSSFIAVLWDNGKHNGYKYNVLELLASVDKNDPNVVFSRRKRNQIKI